MKSLRSFLSECSGGHLSESSKFFNRKKEDKELRDWITARQKEIESGELQLDATLAYYDYLVSILPKGINSAGSNDFMSDLKLDELKILYDYLGKIPSKLLKEDPFSPSELISISEDREKWDKRILKGKKKWKERKKIGGYKHLQVDGNLMNYPDLVIKEGIPNINNPFERAKLLLDSVDNGVTSNELSGKLDRRRYYKEKKAAIELISDILKSPALSKQLKNVLSNKKIGSKKTKTDRVMGFSKNFVKDLVNNKYSTNQEVLDALNIVESKYNPTGRLERELLKNDGTPYESRICKALANIFAIKYDSETIHWTVIRDAYKEVGLSISQS